MDAEFENFMKLTKQQVNIADKDLDDLIEDDEELKTMMKKQNKKKKKNKDAELSLSDLEDEDDIKISDDESEKLEGLSDEEEEKKKSDPKKENINPNIPNKTNESNSNKKEVEKNAINQPVKPATTTSVDLYSDRVESLYHRTDKIKSIGVLQEELKILDDIIAFKTKKNFDPDYFDNKKTMVEAEIMKIENMCSIGVMTLDMYKKTIQAQLNWEEQLLVLIEKDNKTPQNELNIVKERISKRIEIIKSELVEEIQEEPEEETIEEINSEVKDEKKPEKNSETKQTVNVINPETEKIIEKKPVEIKNKKLYEEIKIRLNDYKDAADYFRKIGSAKQEEDAFNKAREIQKAVKLIEEGQEDKVDEFSLPISITPDYICGSTKQERLNNFSNIIKEFSKRKNELNEALKERAEKLTKIDKREFAKIKDAVMKDLQERKNKVEFYTKLISKLTEYAKNPWVPAPLYSYVEEEEQVEKINEEIEPLSIHVHIGNTTYDKSNAYLWVNLSLSDTKTLSEYIYFKQFPSYDAHLKWKLEKGEFSYLFRKTLEIQVFRTHWYWPFKGILKGTVKIKLDPLKTVSKINDSFTYKLESKRFDPKLDVTITLRNPISGKEYTTVSKTVLTITKTFPPFRGEGAVESHNYPGSDKKVDLSDKDMTQSIKPVKKPESNVSKPQKEATKTQPIGDKPKQQQSTDAKSNKPRIDPSIFTQTELNDPDHIDNINTIKVMEFKIDKLQNQINAIEGRAPPKLREKLIKIKCKKNIFEQQLGDSISIQDYIMLMKTQIEKDRKLALYFEQEKMIDKAKIVAERIPIIIKELEEALEFAKSSKH